MMNCLGVDFTPPPHEHHIHWVFSNHLSEIGRLGPLIDDIRERYNLPDHLAFRLNLVLDELITNTLSYGYTDNRSHEIHIHVFIQSSIDPLIDVFLIDDGVAFNPLEKHTPDLTKSVEERPIGGLGIHFTRQFTHHQSYQRHEKGINILHLTFPLK